MNSRMRYAVNALLGITIALTLLLAFPEANRSRAKSPAVGSAVVLRAGTTVFEEGSATLSPAKLNTWSHLFKWYTDRPYCLNPFEVVRGPEDVAGSIIAGFKHRFDKGKSLFGCPDGSNTVFRGTVWFDLSEIMSKAPPLHVAATTATLRFNKSLDADCAGELLVGTADWLKGYPDNTLVPGDPLAALASCKREDCSIDVKTVVNNWLRGEEHGGYANYGFVFKGMQEADLRYGDNASCLARYGNFSLTVSYKYDKEPIILVVLPMPTPKKADTLVGKPDVFSPGEGLGLARTNVALAANGGVASASSFTPDTEIPGYEFRPSAANDGNISGSTYPHNGFWRDGTDNVWPDWLQVDFAGSNKISEIDVYGVQDTIDTTGPTDKVEGLPFTLNGIVDFEVQYWDGSAWQTIPGGIVKGNNKVLNKFTLTPAIPTTRIRVYVTAALNKRSRIVELEAWK